MNCKYVQNRLVDLFDARIDKKADQDLWDHVNSCDDCGQEYYEMEQVLDSIKPSVRINVSSNFKESVISRTIEEETAMNKIAEVDCFDAISAVRNFFKTRLNKPVVIALMAVILLVALPTFNWFAPKDNRSAKFAFSVLAEAVKATSDLRSVHIKARMRTLPYDNFELIGTRYRFVKHDMWKEFGDPPKWRIEKPGRVIVMDGKEQLMYIKPPGNKAWRQSSKEDFRGWLGILLNPQQVLDKEQRLAREEASELKIAEKEGQLILTVEAKAKGDFSNDWLKNKSISASDNRRVYRFDAQTKLLEALQVYVHAYGKDILVFEITQIEYNVDIDPALFSLVLSDDVIWFKNSGSLPVKERLKHLTAEEAARAFFQTCADEDWEEYLEFSSTSAVSQRIKAYLGDLEIISIGKSFKSGRYPGWFVPYEVKLKSGRIKKMNLAIRNDNPAKRWIVDGGF